MSDEASRATRLSKRIMLVCSDTSRKTAKYLRAAGHQVTRVSEGAMALSHAKRNRFDLAVLVSTGKTMDLTETALNLQDVSPSTQIVILANADDREQIPMSKPSVSQIIPQAKVLTAYEFEQFLKCL